MKTLDHYTVESGHVRTSPASEVGADVLARVGQALGVALASSAPVDVGAGWVMEARADGGALEARLWVPGMDTTAPPGVVMRVEHRDGRPPLLTAAMAGIVHAPDVRESAMQAGDLERCIAWAWLSGAAH